MTYAEKKERAKQKALNYQAESQNKIRTWGEIWFYGRYFEKLGKRYGLIKEFKENGII